MFFRLHPFIPPPQKAYAAFQMEYQAFLRATQYSYFDFPLCQALKFISQGEMVKANTVLLPFPHLRPLAIVLGVFRAPMFSSKYNIVIQVRRARRERKMSLIIPMQQEHCSHPSFLTG